MRLTRYTDYAFRVLFYLGVHAGRAVPISEMARAYDVSHNHLVKVVHHLGKGGYLRSVRGRGGGVMLARPADTIGLGAVVRHTEPSMTLVDCLGCTIAPACALPGPLQKATAAFIAVLDEHTLADIVADSRGLDLILAPRG